MATKNISNGAIHAIPSDLKNTIIKNKQAYNTWEDITPLARNEWICWVTSAKKVETRKKRIKQSVENLKEGKRRPCCWPGCSHRNKKRS